MAVLSLRGHVDLEFLERLQGLAVGEVNAGAALRRALTSTEASETRIQAGLRVGAQSYVTALSGINFAGSLVNIAESDLAQIDNITNRMMTLATEAAHPNASLQKRRRNNTEYHDLARKFGDILDSAEFGAEKYLTLEGITNVFTKIGLDPTELRQVQDVFDEFAPHGSDGLLADPDLKDNDKLLPRGIGLPDGVQSFVDLLSPQRDLLSRANATKMLYDLNKLSNQIQSNLSALESSRALLLDNAILVRETALALTEVAEQINSGMEANDVARMLRQLIRRNAREALAQAEHLEPLVVAALTLDDEALLGDG